MKQIHILLIEDNLGDITLIKEYIDAQFSSSYITVARNYCESLVIISDTTTAFDIILLDLNLPDKNGELLVKEIIVNEKIKCPIIILTGYRDMGFSIKSISLGISDYLLKDELTSGMLYKSIIYAIERSASKLKLKESESKFSLFFNLSPQPKWVYSLVTSKFINVNEAAIKHYGYTEQEFLKMGLVDLHVPEERKQISKRIKYVFSKKLSLSGSFRQIKKSGEEIDVEVYSTFLIIDERPCWTVIAIDVTEKNMTEIKLTQAIIKTQEDERFAIGSELHDNICQILVSSMLNLSSIKSSLNEDKAAILSHGMSNIKLATTEIRNISHRLAPAFFDDMNLKESLMQLLSSINLTGKFETHLTFGKEVSSINLKRDLQINFYRITQEQLNNILKYAKASIIHVSLSIVLGDLRFEISDNGVGFDEYNVCKGIGFANMSRRANLFSGRFKVESSPNNGCKVIITIPSHQLT